MVDIIVNDFKNFNPRPPRGGRLGDKILALTGDIISIHAPREGGDASRRAATSTTIVFQSTPPARGATFLIVNR